MHYLAAYTPTAQGRYVTSAENTGFLELASYLLADYGGQYPLPTRQLPKWLVWLIAPSAGMTRASVSKNIGLPWRASHAKAEQELGMQFRPLAPGMREMFQQLIDAGQV
jgi:hypothetical protein